MNPTSSNDTNSTNNQMAPPQAPESSQANSLLREVLSTIGVLLVALVVALGLIAFVFQSYQVDGPSMETTLQNQDRLIVWKLPRTWSHITHHQYVPKRGDVVVFVEGNLEQYGQGSSKQLIKRVIGLPGERIVVNNGAVKIYNADHPEGFIPDKTLPYGSVIPYTQGNIDITLGQNELFVCGDNRPNSLDSRSFGPIKTNQIVGKLVLRVFPLNQVKKF